jgi:hypothetical protein
MEHKQGGEEAITLARAGYPSSSEAPVQGARSRRRVGIVQCISEIDESGGRIRKRRAEKYDDSALRYLILSMNSLQSFLQFEFVPFDEQDEFLAPLVTRSVTGRPPPIMMQRYYDRQHHYLQQAALAHNQPDERPDYYQVISIAQFSDNYFYTSNARVSVLALVRAENSVHGSDQQSCVPSRPAVMITDHVPAVYLPPDHAGGFVAAPVPA